MPILPSTRFAPRARRRWTLLAILALVSAAVLAWSSAEPPTLTSTGSVSVPPLHSSVDGYEAGRVVLSTTDGATAFDVRIARTNAERTHGLMEVTELPDGVGMWFAYDSERDGGFWMKNTLVDLDIVYVAEDGTIVDVANAVPCPPDTTCPTYPSAAPFAGVLEVAGGTMDAIGAGIGDRAELLDDRG